MNPRYGIALALSVVVGAALMFGATPFWWFGAGMIAAGGVVSVWTHRREVRRAVDWAKRPRTVAGFEIVPATIVAELLCLAVIAGVTIAMMPEVTFGDRPVNHDHTVHFFKAWQLEQHFLAEGHLYGWSHRWFGGYPAQYLYPIGSDLLVVGLHVASFGLMTLEQAYAWGIWIFWFLGGYAVYRFGANAFGRWGGLLAGILFMTDTAANRIGGWYFAMEWGVWPMSFSVVLSVWAMSRVPRLMTETKWRDVAIFGLLMAAALVTHPFMLIHFALALTVAVLAFWFADTDVHWLVGTGRLVLGWATGVLVAMIWVLPFMSANDFMDPHFGGRWENFYKIGTGFYQLDMLPGTWAVAILLGGVGMVALLWSRSFERLLGGLLCLTFVVVGSTDFLASFNFLEVFESFQRVHFKRFITLLKPYWMVAAAYAIVALVRHTARHAMSVWRERTALEGDDADESEGTVALQPAAKRWVQVFLIVACLFPLAVPFGQMFGGKHIKRKLDNASVRPHQQARDALVAWFEREYPDGEPFFRVAMELYRHNHRFVDLGTRIPFPIYKIGYTPATSFAFRPEEGSPEVLNAFNVKYAVSLNRGPPRGNFKKVEQFGALTLYENEDWQEEPFEIIEGSGEVSMKSFGTEEIVLEAEEGSEGRLRLNVSNFSRWHAYRDGREVPIGETTVAGNESTGFMTVDLKPGTYRFVFERHWPETIAWLLFLIGLVLAAGFALADTKWRVGRRIADRLERVQSWVAARARQYSGVLDVAGVLFVALGLLFLGWMAWHWPELRVKHSSLAEETEQVHYDFGDQLRHASVFVHERGGPEPCQGMLGYFVCGDTSWKIVHQRMEDFGPELSMARCIWAHPLSKGTVELRFDDVPSGEAIIGYYGVAESGTSSKSAPVKFDVGIDGVQGHGGEVTENKKLYTFRTPVDASGTMDVNFEVSSENPGKRHFCFNAQVVDLTEGAPVDSAESDSERDAGP